MNGEIFPVKPTNADIALLTESRYCAEVATPSDWYLANILTDDRLLQDALRGRGLSSVRVDWADSSLDWASYKCVVFRTTWDYFDRFNEFSNWLKLVNKKTKLCNPESIIHWNMDKHYLSNLFEKGIPVVESSFVEKATRLDLRELIKSTDWNKGVIKPCVSGAARHTYRVDISNAQALNLVLEKLIEKESFVFQPFQESVLEKGEDTLMVFNGKYSHAIRKLPKPGDFRVQDDHGGTVHYYQPTFAQIELAERAIAVCDPKPAYGRVDLVTDNCGKLAVMELELIEPELWLRMHPPSAQYFAEAIVKLL